jgi:hypothetical protein
VQEVGGSNPLAPTINQPLKSGFYLRSPLPHGGGVIKSSRPDYQSTAEKRFFILFTSKFSTPHIDSPNIEKADKIIPASLTIHIHSKRE